MVYLVAFVIAVLVILNLYTSWKVLRDGLSTGKQQLLQLCLIWLLPIIGPVLTASLVSGTRHPTVDTPSRSGMAFVSYWHSSERSDDGSHVSSDSSCD